MTIQIATVKHVDSNIKQCIFIDWEQGSVPRQPQFTFQSIGFGSATQRPITKIEACDAIRAWAELARSGMATLGHEDEISLFSQFGYRKMLDFPELTYEELVKAMEESS